jgi:predicted nucleic acid-binding protein
MLAGKAAKACADRNVSVRPHTRSGRRSVATWHGHCADTARLFRARLRPVILLDTNVVSETMKRRVDPVVAAFIDQLQIGELFLPSLVAAEIRYGLRRLPTGRRRDEIEADFAAFLEAGFASRILAFDGACAVVYATARTAGERTGRPVSIQDALIGGMALAHGATLATRNIADFEGYGLSRVNPWQEARS